MWIWVFHNGIDGGQDWVSCALKFSVPLLKTSNFDGYFTHEQRLLQHHARGKTTQACGIFVKKVFFFFLFQITADPPPPLRELHSTDETRVWRDPWES